VFDFSTDPTTATLTDAKFHRLGGQRVTPINPVRQWPSDVPPVDPPEEEPVKPQDQFAREFRDTNDFYKAPDGLQRPGGMVLNGECDVEAMQQWGYQLLGNNHSVNWVKNQIVRSDEWAQKHPGEAPPTFPEGAGDQ
jgi:hypothetical protein